MSLRSFKCSVCSSRFNRKSGLNVHLRTHTLEKPFKCDLCDRKFSQKGNLLFHCKTLHEKRREFYCVFCEKVFSSKYDEWVHLLRHVEEKPLSCDICGISFFTNGDRLKHLRSHTGEKVHKCRFCKKSYSELRLLRIHEAIHAGQRIWFRCSTCDAKFATRTGLKSHDSKVHGGLVKKHGCVFCSEGFHSKGSLFDHLLRHTNEKPYACQLCQASFSGASERSIHLATHFGEKAFKCKVCKKSFSQRGYLERHQVVHARKRSHKCSRCGAKFTNQLALKTHERRIHDGFVRQNGCVFCPKWFGSRTELFDHLRRHVKEKPYSCKFCDASFPNSCGRSQHILGTHASARGKRYACNICGKSFTHPYSVRGHQATVHASRRTTFECSGCEKTFLSKRNLELHRKRAHDVLGGELCVFCLKCFNFKSELYNHLFSHTKEKPYTCELCNDSFSIISKFRKHFKLHHS